MAPTQSAATAEPLVERSTPAPPPENRRGSDAVAFGAFLRGQRERRRLTVHQIAATTKIAPHHFSSLENGDVRRWPGGMYRRAMVRAYARAIGLDAEETVRAFLVVFSEENSQAPLALPAAPRINARREVGLWRAASATAVGGVAVAILLIVWYAASYTGGVPRPDAVSAPPQPVPVVANSAVEATEPGLPDLVATPPTTSAATPGTTTEAGGVTAAVIEGELRIRTDPDGAQVTVNGIGWGRTPVTIKYLPPGEKRVRLTKDGYQSAEHRVPITAERPARTLQVTLQPRPDRD